MTKMTAFSGESPFGRRDARYLLSRKSPVFADALCLSRNEVREIEMPKISHCSSPRTFFCA
jgi:hypothetical protein